MHQKGLTKMSKIMKSSFKLQRSLAAIAVSSALIFTSPSVLSADKVNGSIKGNVAVASGNALANVNVEIKHESKGLVRSTLTDKNGAFNIKALPIGRYTISFSKNGFETAIEKSIEIQAGNQAGFNVDMYTAGVERISVTGSSIQTIDFDNSTTQLVLTADELAILPVGQNLTSVALLAPGSSLAADPDADYGRGASFNGSSVAENGYFLNGLNITDIRKGLGHIDLPWEAIAQTNVVTGGVSAEYGQFIGGVTDLVSKSGSNEFKFGVTVDYLPSSLSSQSPNTWGYSTQAEDDGSYAFDKQLIANNQEDSYEEKRYNIYASGAIIEDTLFFYGIFNPQKITDDYANASSKFTHKSKEADYWLAKVDWYVTDEHSLGFTALNNEWEQHRYENNEYDFDTGKYGELSEPAKSTWGGELWSVNYSGIITDEITVNAVYGVTKQDSAEINPTPDQSKVWDRRDNWGWDKIGNWVGDNRFNQQDDKRTQLRVDLDWEFGDHTVRFGYSHEKVETTDNIVYAGDGKSYEYRVMSQGTLDWVNNNRASLGQAPVTNIAAGDDYFRSREYSRIGTAESNNYALYIEDTWNVTDEVTLNLGVRNSSFDSFTGEGDKYADMSNQWAPRLGAIWDINGDGVTKLSLNYGRYYMPISPNTSVRMTLGEKNQYDYATFGAIGADGLPTNPETMYLLDYGDGTFTQPYETLIDADLDPMYSDELSLALTHELNDDWVVGARILYQELKSSIEDTNMKYTLEKWIKENPAEADKLDPNWDISGSWVGIVINPGSPVHLSYDQNGDGKISSGEGVTWDPDYIGLPKAKRKYQALELTLEGKPNESSTLSVSYTYSQSKGNTEGLVSGTHSQADPGWSGSFDSPEFTDHSYGNTSNDIPHKFKAYGTYEVIDDLTFGFVFIAQEGRARNILGYHPKDVDSCAESKDITSCADWDRNNFYVNGKPSQRGAGGHGDWIVSLDLSANYKVKVGDSYVSLSAKVFNALDSDTASSYNDMTEFDKTIGLKDPNFGNPTSYQAPRSFLFSARYDF